MKRIAVQLAEGFEEIEAVTIIDILRRAEIEVITISITGKLEITGSHKITIIADQLFEDTDYSAIDMIILPGGMPGAEHLNNHSGLKKQIIEFSKKGKQLGAICAAPLVFGELGLLKNMEATCYPGFENRLKGATTTGKNIEVSGSIITGKGAGVAIEFSLKIVKILSGEKFAGELAEKLMFLK